MQRIEIDLITGEKRVIQLDPQEIPEPTPVVVPEVVISPWQFRTVLNKLSLRDAVENMVKNSNDYLVKDGWEFATSWREKHPLVQQMGLMLGLSPDDIHDIFVMASEIDTL